jgi:hypothetical protein
MFDDASDESILAVSFPSYHPLYRLTCDISPEAISMVTSMFIFHRAVSEVLTPRTVLHMLN